MRQRLGQHFLINHAAVKKIAAGLEASPEDIIVEIGPGPGQITRELSEIYPDNRIFVIELDEKLAADRRKEFESNKLIRIIQGDVLEELPKLITSLNKKDKYDLIGNLPYYLTGKLMREIGGFEKLPKTCVFTIQREVAERITSKEPQQNRLSAAVNFWAIPKIILKLKPGDFRPRPKVDSATLKLTSKDINTGDIALYDLALESLFRQPRKKITNNLVLSGWNKPETQDILRNTGLSPDLRPQDLSTDQICKIGRVLYDQKQKKS